MAQGVTNGMQVDLECTSDLRGSFISISVMPVWHLGHRALKSMLRRECLMAQSTAG